VSSPVVFSLLNREIVAADAQTGAPLWAVLPFGHPVLDLVQLPDAPVAVALLDSSGTLSEAFESVVAIDREGKVLWRAPLPTSLSFDTFTAIELVDDSRITAYSWSGYLLEIDAESGTVLSSTFTK
jgi:outer membrane protein assembly factor BamB